MANVGIVTGEASNVDVLDLDPGHDPWPEDGRKLDASCVVATPSGGRHYYYRHIDGVRNSASKLARGIDVRGDGGYVVAPPSVVGGRAYSFVTGLPTGLSAPPDWLSAALVASARMNGRRDSIRLDPMRIPEGERNSTLTSEAGTMRHLGMSEETIAADLLKRNALCCDPPLDRSEVQGIASSVARYPVPPSAYFDRKTFVPLRLARAIKRRGAFCVGCDPERGSGLLMEYRDGVWRPAANIDVQIQEHLQESVRRNRVEETIAALTRDVLRRSWPLWNRERRLINCANGMLDPVTLELRPHSPEYYSTFQIPVAWDPEASCERLDRFVDEVLSREEGAAAVQMIGYLATCDTSVKHLFVLEGEANTGKTVFLSLVTAFIGRRNTAVVSLQDLADNRFALAQLENKSLATFDDLDDRALRSSSLPKVLTGKFDTIRVERKGKDAYNAPLYARMLFTCNSMPPCGSDHSSAWYNRPLIIPFTGVIPEHRQDVDLAREITRPDALRRMFCLAAHGLQELVGQRMLFRETEAMRRARDAYRGRTDTVAAFVEECCTRGPEERVGKALWFTEYRRWCDENKCRPAGRNTAYARVLALGGIGDGKDASGGLIFRGVGLDTRS